MTRRLPRIAAWLVLGLCGLLVAGVAVLQISGGLSAESADDAAGFNGWGGWVFRLAFVACAGVGQVIVTRAPGNSIGPLFLLTGLLGLVGDFAYQYADRGLYRSGDPLPGSYAAAVAQNVSAAVFGTLGLALLLFPDGRLPSRGVRWAAAVPLVGMTSVILGYALVPGPIEFFEEADNPWGVAALEVPAMVLVLMGWVLMPLGVVLGGIVTVRRFRRSTGLARQQLKWVALAGVTAGALLLANLASWLIDDTSMSNLRNALIGLGLGVFPVAVGIAILRYQLYDVDVVINRTLVYSVLTASLAATYLVVVLLLQTALQPLTESSDLAVAGSTLLVAALFRPARSRIQAAVDRRFYRSRYDAARTLTTFTSGLRDQVDLQTLSQQLLTVAHETVQPEHASLWLREG